MLQIWSSFCPRFQNWSLPQTSMVWREIAFFTFSNSQLISQWGNYCSTTSAVNLKILPIPLKRRLQGTSIYTLNLSNKLPDSDFSSALFDCEVTFLWMFYLHSSKFLSHRLFLKYLSWIFKAGDCIFKIKFNFFSQWNEWQVPCDYFNTWQASLLTLWDCKNEH